jgi:hypothetical protein
MAVKETFSTTDENRKWREAKLNEFLELNANRVKIWQRSHPPHVKPPIFWSESVMGYVWLNRDDLRTRTKTLKKLEKNK